MAGQFPFIPYEPAVYPESEMMERSRLFFEEMNKRRSVRTFSDRSVPLEMMENLIRTASTAPSGANKQPWTFCLVGDAMLKRQIREAAEQEEFESYNGRMSAEWLADLAPLGTDWRKPFLETAPWLVVIFKRAYEIEKGEKKKNYYVNESVGLAAGLFITAIHHAGLVTLTHTPSPMDFLTRILNRPENERPFLLLPVGFAAESTEVPDIQRKPIEKVLVKYG